MVDRCAAALHGELDARAVSELVRVQPQAEARGASRVEHRPTLVGVERSGFAERVHPFRVGRRCGEHVGAHEVDVVVGTPLELGRQQMGAEERRLARVGAGDADRPRLVDHVQSVPRLDLDGGGAGPMRLVQSSTHQQVELVGGRAASRVGGDPDPATVVRVGPPSGR